MIYLIAYPYIELIVILGILFRNISANGFIYEVDHPLIAALEIILLIIPYIIALIVSFVSKNITPKRNMIIKLSHILFYIGIFILGILMSLTVFGIVISIICVFIDIFNIIPSGIYMCRLKNVPILQRLCGFIFVIDVIMSIYIYTKNKNGINLKT